jgi:hypothetical protein
VYFADPLTCPKCGESLCLIGFIKKILPKIGSQVGWYGIANRRLSIHKFVNATWINGTAAGLEA